ncbi:hypothetical protein V7S43_018672 [Phytophthora oleae]|uniref:RxLR effector protein n=1 Tax=Phytophthora oleae TaxID=2107226 RepID=A0ABD3EPU5_9STRA
MDRGGRCTRAEGAVCMEIGFVILHFFRFGRHQTFSAAFSTSSSMLHSPKLSLSFCFAVMVLLSTASALDVRHLTDATSAAHGVPIAAVAGVAAAAAVAVVVLVVIKLRRSDVGRRPKDVELHEVVISPSQPAAQPLSTKKQFVYTAHI